MPALRVAAFLLTLAVPTAAAELPTFAQVRADWRASEALLLDRHGTPLQEFRVDFALRRTAWTPLAEVSPALVAALLAAEDRRFFEHAGVDWLAAGKAALTNWLRDRPRGASTLSMQLVALLDANYRGRSGRRGLGEKWDQMQAARELERTWRKEDILEAYLNLVPFRGEIAGVDAAARGLFDKRPAGLGPDEGLILAALIRAPNARPDEVARRVCALAGHIADSPDCVRLRARTRNTLSGRYPILPAYNLAPHLVRQLSVQAGERFTTTLDAGLQRHVRDILKTHLAQLAGRNVHDAAALVVDNASGEVLAYASLSGAESASPLSDGVQAPRQAGSTLKPFLYALALEGRLLTAASPLEDRPLALSTPGGQYAPDNYDHAYRGLASVRMALAGSLNIPAVQTLRLVGLEPFATRLTVLGFEGLSEAADWYGYALALGSLDVRLWELVNAYRSLANGGLHSPLRLTRATRQAKPRRVFGADSAWLVGDILADRQARAVTFGLESPLATRYWTAVKTGTSKDMRDNWCVGWSPAYTVGVWVGNFDGAPMHDVSGMSGAAPAWAAIMDRLHAALPTDTPPPPPPGLLRSAVRPPGEPERQEWFLPGSTPPEGAWIAARPPARIVSPGDGSILALDPDIPPDRQRLPLVAQPAQAGQRWRMDGQPIADDSWAPQHGRHILSLLDEFDRELDRVTLEVR